VGKVVDSKTELSVSFAIVNIEDRTELTNAQGSFFFTKGDTIRISHPLFYSVTVIGTDTVVQGLDRKEKNDLEPLSQTEIQRLQSNLIDQNAFNKISFQYFGNVSIELQQNQSDVSPNGTGWEKLYSVSQVYKERFVQPNSWYREIITQEIINSQGQDDDFEIKIPAFMNNLVPTLEYLNIVEDRFYNPMFKGAEKRYNYYKRDTIILNNFRIRYILTEPKPNKRFKAFRSLFVVNMDNDKVFGYTYQTLNHANGTVSVSVANESFFKRTMVPKQINVNGYFPRYPRRRQGLIFNFSADLYDFEVIDPDTTSRKLSFALLGQTDSLNKPKDSIELHPLDDKFDKNLHYIKSDSTNEKVTVEKVGKFGLDFSEGKLALKAGPVFLTNVFGLNKYEGLRLGIGVKTREEISDKWIASAYGAFGFGDGKFKYGMGLGYRLGKKQKSGIALIFLDDLREPGRPRYTGEERDIFRNFFASRMDRVITTSLYFETKPSFYLKFDGGYEDYFLQPQYKYRYAPTPLDTIGTFNRFHFSEIKFRMLLGARVSDHKGLSHLFMRQWGKLPKLFVNYSRGLDWEGGGDYGYGKLNAKLNQVLKWSRIGIFDLTFEAGLMTENTPYQVMFTAPGSDTALGSIIVKDAFQTVELYKFISDRFLHSFINYHFRESSNNLKRFNPRLGFSWSMGWGKVNGNINIHKEIIVQDYVNGYYEAGILVNDLLNLNVYNYFVARLGLGFYVGMGSYTTDFPVAARLTYSITPR